MDFIKMTDVDVAYYILQQRGKGNHMHYRQLIEEVIEKRHKPVTSLAESISEIYTQINMDSRFQYEKNGNWGLTEWDPESKHSSSRSSSHSSTSTSESRKKQNDMKKFEDIQLSE